MTTITPDPKPSKRTKRQTGTTPAGNPIVTTDEVVTAPAPPKGPRKPRLTKAQKDAVIDQVASEVPAIVAAVEEAIADETTGPIVTPVTNNDAALANLKAAAKASAARRAANAADKAKVKGLNAEESAARKAKTAALHASFVDAFKGGKTIGQIAAEFVNPDTGKPRGAGAVRNVLIAAGLVKVGEPRAPKITLTPEQIVEVREALVEITRKFDASIPAILRALKDDAQA